MKIVKLFPVFITIASFAVALMAKPHVPYLMASHWGPSGNVDGYMSQNMALFFMPVLSLLIYALFLFLPKLDPYKENFKQFEHHYYNFMAIIMAFFFYTYILTIVWNLGCRFEMIQLLSPAFAVLFYYAGVLTSNSRQNWFVGIRTPWTMSSKAVWQKTHKVGGKLFKLVGLFSLLGTFFPEYATYFLLIPILFTVVFVYIYSYIVYSRYNQS